MDMPKFSGMNWVSSCMELGGPFHNKSTTVVINVRWGSLPYPFSFTGKCVRSCTPLQSLGMFPRECSLVSKVNSCVLYHIHHLDWRYNCVRNKEGVVQSTSWHVNSNPNNPVVNPVNALVMYMYNHTPSSLYGAGIYFLVFPVLQVH